MPNIGYGSAKATKHVCPDGFKKVLVHNIKELEVLLMQNRTFSAEIAIHSFDINSVTVFNILKLYTFSALCFYRAAWRASELSTTMSYVIKTNRTYTYM